MKRQNWPVALAILFIVQIVWYLLYTRHIVQALEANSESLSEVYAQVQDALASPEPPPADEFLIPMQAALLEARVPLVLSGPGDTIFAAENLPFEADLTLPEGQERVREYIRRIDLKYPPRGDSTVQLIHFGDPPEVRGLKWIPFFQAGGLLTTAFLGLLAIRIQRRSEAEKAWTSMARELAHQLGTPISSLQGWLEVLGLSKNDRPEGLGRREIAMEIGADVARLEKISHRFELIGMEPQLEAVSLQYILRDLQRYMEARIPRLSAGVEMEVLMPEDLPPVMGNHTLLTWAFENLVKNSLDALGGTGGLIKIEARNIAGREALVSVSDTGPGVPLEVRGEIFEPGVTTKERGWGVGLALSRRIVEGVHRGRLDLGDEGSGGGATFHIHLPFYKPESRT